MTPWITQHPYWTAAVILYAIFIAWMVYEMRKAPTVHNTGDEIIYTDETHFD